MNEEQQSLPNPSSEPNHFSGFHSPSSKIFFITLLFVIFLVSGIGGFFLGTMSKNANKATLIPSPTLSHMMYSPIPSHATVSPISLPSNCASDSQCPSGYSCQALRGEGTACPVGVSTNGVVTNTVISCTPTYKIVSGVCKLKKDEICKSDSDCISGLICHTLKQDNLTVDKCEEPTLGTCSGASDTSCPAGYQCTEGCGPPIVREGDTNPVPWYCMANEVAYKPRACPVCLASNTMIATPQGEINVTKIVVGMLVWSINEKGEKTVSKIIKVGSTVVPSTHKVVHLVLSDGRSLWVSPNHPTATGTFVGNLRSGESYDDATIIHAILVPYWDTKTYDILPDSSTGFYYANGILMGSTLK